MQPENDVRVMDPGPHFRNGVRRHHFLEQIIDREGLVWMHCRFNRQILPLSTEQITHCPGSMPVRSEEHTSELQSRFDLVCRLLLENKKENRRRDGYKL